MTNDTAASAHEEMAYETGTGSFEQSLSTSIPAQLRFTERPDQDTDRFHAALEFRGFSPLDHEPDRTMGGRTADRSTPYYEGEVCSREDYKRLKIWVGRGEVVRIFPREDGPSVDELAAILEALEVGFDAPLTHDPID